MKSPLPVRRVPRLPHRMTGSDPARLRARHKRNCVEDPRIQRVPGLPDPLLPLLTLARDLRWTWRPELRALFSTLDRQAWEHVRGNALAFLHVASRTALARAAEDPEYLSLLAQAVAALDAEDAALPDHPAARQMAERGERVGYFCMDRDSTPGRLVFNRAVTLRDTWAKIEKAQQKKK